MSENWIEEKKPLLKLLLVFFACILTFIVVMNLPFFEKNIYPKITSFNAIISSFILNIFGFGTTAVGDSIVDGSTSVSIRKGCDALAPIAIFTSVMLAYPVVFSKKWKGVVYGILFLLIINIIRIVSLFIFNLYDQDLFHLMHTVIWQGIFIFLALALSFYWLKKYDDAPVQNQDKK